MSGPKGYNAALEARLRRERELAARRRTWAALIAQIDRLEHQARVYGASTDSWDFLAAAGYSRSRAAAPSTSDLDRIDDFSHAVSATLDHCRDGINDRLAADVRASLGEVQAALGDAASITVTALSQGNRASAAAPMTDSRSDRSATAKKAGILIDLLGRAGERREQLAARIAAAAQDGADERTWLTLAREVADAARAEKDRAARHALADQLLALVARVDDSTVVADLTARIEAAPARSALEALRPAILEAIATAERLAERRFILEQAAEVWCELGYEVHTEFTEVALSGSTTLLHRPSWPNHALQVRFSADRAELATNVVSLAETSLERDREIEEDHCATVAGFTSRLSERGVDATRIRAKPPGALPVQKVSSAARVARSRRTTQKKTL